ncbi:MAG: hypothetical protein JRI95_01495 [Deltaproteobacteria bacterium]|nr:hypothetical protein [Deltaproteobacteria bacterium]MBW2084543.1 hypothetical protein [Deltaproteobacteria bacterium]
MFEIKKGVYLKTTKTTLGMGVTAREQELKSYYLADILDENRIRVQLLDIHGKPLALTEEIGMEEFEGHFVFQPDFYKNLKSLDEIKVDRIITRAEKHYENNEYLSAEYEYKQALSLEPIPF